MNVLVCIMAFLYLLYINCTEKVTLHTYNYCMLLYASQEKIDLFGLL